MFQQRCPRLLQPPSLPLVMQHVVRLTSMIENPMASFATSGRTSPCTRIVCRHPSCRISRTCRAGRKQGQGLPLGFLIGWLRGSADEIGGSAAAHRLYQPTYEQRSAGRQWLREQADADWLFELEQGEGDEPLVFA